MQEKQYKKKEDALKEGVFAEFYTLKGWFLRVKQAYAIDRVQFAFVKKDTGGKGFNIYVDMDSFDLLCDDILSGAMRQRIDADNGNYPKAWEKIVGKDGQYVLAIGKGQRQPVVIQGRDTKYKQNDGMGNAFVGIGSYDELRVMAKWFKRTSKSYYEKMADICAAAQVYRPKETCVRLDCKTSGRRGLKDNVYYVPVALDNRQPGFLAFDAESFRAIPDAKHFVERISTAPARVSVMAIPCQNNIFKVRRLT